MSRRLSSPTLVGRVEELATLTSALADVRAGISRVVLIEGDAGIGKTRLVETFVATVAGAKVLLGGGIPLAADAPYAPMLDIFRALAAAHPPAAGGLLLGVGDAPTDGFGPTRLLGAAADAVRTVATCMPVVLVVEDLHWVDASTRDLLAYLARSIRREAVLLVVTVRAEELDPARPFSLLVGELNRLPHVQRLVLQPLSPSEVAAQAAQITGLTPSQWLLDRLMARAAGNPFFIEELLASGSEATALPATVREVILGRASRLSAPSQRVLRAAAVLGRNIPHELLAQVVEPTDLREGIDAMIRHRMIEGQNDGYVFRHPLIQEAVYADLLPADRQTLHARAASALDSCQPGPTAADRAGHAALTAFHWHAAREFDKALQGTVHAADLAIAAHAPADAFAHYTQAMTAWPTVVDPARAAGIDQCTLMERAAESASVAGENRCAQQLARQVLDRVDIGSDPLRAALWLERLGWFSWMAGDQATSWQAYDQALRVVPGQASRERARVLAANAQSLMLRGQHLSSRDHARRAIDVARAVGARAEEAPAHDTLGVVLATIGHHAEGIASIEQALRIAREVGDASEVARCLVNRTEMLVDARQFADALRVGEEGVREAKGLGFDRVHAAAVLGAVLDALLLSGRWDDIDTRSSAALDADPEPWSALPIRVPRCRLALTKQEDLAGL